MFSSHSLDVNDSEYRQPRDVYHVRTLRTMDGARVSTNLGTMVIFVLSLMASLGKYAFRIQHPYQLIDYSKDNGFAVVY